MICGSGSEAAEASSSFPRFRASCNVILALFHVTYIVCFHVRTVFMFQKIKNRETNKQTNCN